MLDIISGPGIIMEDCIIRMAARLLRLLCRRFVPSLSEMRGRFALMNGGLGVMSGRGHVVVSAVEPFLQDRRRIQRRYRRARRANDVAIRNVQARLAGFIRIIHRAQGVAMRQQCLVRGVGEVLARAIMPGRW